MTREALFVQATRRTRWPSWRGPRAATWVSSAWRPIMNDSLIGVVADDGSLTLPALGRRGASFAGDIHTADQLVAAARAPVTTEHVTVP
jgi:hypothetical protein